MGIQPVSQGLTLRSAHAWGLMLWSPFEILNIVALSLKCVFCRCSSVGQWACTRGLEPQLSAVPPSSASRSPQEGFSAAHPQPLEPWGSEPCRGRPAYCHHPTSQAETRHRSKEGQGQACAPQCLGWGKVAVVPTLRWQFHGLIV